MPDAPAPTTRSRLGFWVGLAVAVPLLLGPAPPGISPAAWVTGGVAVLMAIWWVTEALPLAITALLPLALLPLLGAAPLEHIAAAYANPLIFLFLGGFLLARAVEKSGLHRRLALAIIALAGRDPRGVVGAFMVATAFLSLWLSNTAATMVMAPIAAALTAARGAGGDGFAAALMLGTAYAASIGGMGSLIGTPPNAIFAAYMAEAHGVVIGFAEWMAVGLPAVILMLAGAWVLLTRVSFRITTAPLDALPLPPGPMGARERRVAIICLAAALGWMLRPLIAAHFPGLGLSDAGIAVLAALALFAVPAGERAAPLLTWAEAASLRWDVLILFGGGLALAAALDHSGVAALIAEAAHDLAWMPPIVVLAATALVVVYVGELASNTAMAAIFLPVVGAIALGLGQDPLTFALPVALAASVGFMLPVATPPNAIVLAHPAVTPGRMLRAGALLDPLGVLVGLLAGAVLGPLVL
jgi:sodium-dependent dicarboxylate transporter 2/3/5